MSKHRISNDEWKMFDDSEDCKGIIYRCKINSFRNAKGHYVYQERMIPLKRRSCPGCKDCDWIEEFVQNDLDSGITPTIEKAVDGALYIIGAVDHGRMTMDGHEGNWEMIFEKIEKD